MRASIPSLGWVLALHEWGVGNLGCGSLGLFFLAPGQPHLKGPCSRSGGL